MLFGIVFLSGLATPLPSSMIVLASGSFIATGDLELAEVALVTFAAFVLADQTAFGFARMIGPRLLRRLRSFSRLENVVTKSEDLLRRRGVWAVLLSHTIFSPTCPYVSYLAGAGGMKWLHFTSAALLGAVLWCAFYLAIGYTFASELEQVGEIISNLLGAAFSGAIVVYLIWWLLKKWATFAKEDEEAVPLSKKNEAANAS